MHWEKNYDDGYYALRKDIAAQIVVTCIIVAFRRHKNQCHKRNTLQQCSSTNETFKFHHTPHFKKIGSHH